MNAREFYENVIATSQDEEVIAFATKSLDDMNARNEKARQKAADKRVEKEAVKAPIREAIFACITDEPKTATTLIAEAGLEIKPQSIPSLVKPLVESGDIVKVDIKVSGKGTQRGYVRA